MGKKKKKDKLKICFAASSGGHYEQLMMLKPLMLMYHSFIITEKTKYQADAGEIKTYYVRQVNRREKDCIINLIVNLFISIRIYLKERPDIVICTGVLAVVPMCLLCKLMRKKLVYIESFAKITSPTKTGKFLYKYSDRFYVQWESMKAVYPDAVYLGGIY